MNDQPDLRIEKCAVLGHGAQVIVCSKRPVLHNCATGFGCGRHRRPVSMHRRAQPQQLGLATGSFQLLVGQRALAALPDAPGRENFHHVGAIHFQLAHRRPDLLHVAGFLIDGIQRRQNARAGNFAAIDGITQVFIFRRAQALHRGEPGCQRPPGIAGIGQCRLLRRFGFIFQPAIRPKMPGDVDVGIDPSRHHGVAAEIVIGRAAFIRRNALDFSILHRDADVMVHAAFAVEQHPGAQRQRMALCRRHATEKKKNT